MMQPGLAASLAASAGTAACPAIDDRAILDWCFVVGGLNLSFLGVIYATYATARFNGGHGLRIVSILRVIGVGMVTILGILTALAIVVAYQGHIRPAAWIIVFCLLLVFCFSAYLVRTMFTPELPSKRT